jgi:DNA-binding NarL/FixJ family response regulator
MKTITLIDDSHLDLLLINNWLAQNNRYKVVSHYYSGIDAVRETAQLNSDICIIDTYMPLLTGMETTFLLIQKGYKGKILGVSHTFHNQDMIQSREAGANGYCRKEEIAIIETLRRIENENTCFDSMHFNDWNAKNKNNRLTEKDEDLRKKLVNPYFKKILLYSSKGLSSEEIGKLLGLKKHTIEQYRASMLKQLGFNNMAHAVAWAYASYVINHSEAFTPFPTKVNK